MSRSPIGFRSGCCLQGQSIELRPFAASRRREKGEDATMRDKEG